MLQCDGPRRSTSAAGAQADVRRIGNRSLASILVAALFGAGILCAAGGEAQAVVFTDPAFVSELVVTLPPYTPVGLTFAPDGRMFVWQKDGLVRVVRDGVLLSTPFIDIRSRVNRVTDRGLLGAALDPGFATNGWVYLLYTFENGGNPDDPGAKTARLTRVTADPANPDVALPASEIILLGSLGTPPCSQYAAGSDCVPADFYSHTIGMVRVAPDGNLFVSAGDGAWSGGVSPNAVRAQRLNSAAGKLLRIRPNDGRALPDNPFYDPTRPNSIRSKVWAYGLRNPYRFALDSGGQPYIGDVGWEAWEEINRGPNGSRGVNFGWPCYEGLALPPGYQRFPECANLDPNTVTPPLHTYPQLESEDAAIVAGAFYTGSQYPEMYRGNFFFADYAQGWIKRMVLAPGGGVADVFPFAQQVGAPVHLELGPDGLLYYIDIVRGEIRRIRSAASAQPVAVASATPSSGYSPLEVAFSSAGSRDPAGGSLTYQWDFGDGATSTEPNPTHVYTAPGVATFEARLAVTNTRGIAASATVQVTVGSRPPVPLIVTPAGSTPVSPGERVVYTGAAVDPEEGELPSSRLSWNILLHHNDHAHPFVGGEGAGGAFEVDDHGEGVFAYEIVLTATDRDGLSATDRLTLPVETLFWLRLSGRIFGPGDTLSVELGSRNAGPSFFVDVYVGVLLPDGVTVVFLTGHPVSGAVHALSADPRSFPPLARGVLVATGSDLRLGNFVSYTFTGGEPAGEYLLFGAVVRAGALDDGRLDPGDLITLITRPFSAHP